MAERKLDEGKQLRMLGRGFQCMFCGEPGARMPYDREVYGRTFEIGGERVPVREYGWAHPECIELIEDLADLEDGF